MNQLSNVELVLLQIIAEATQMSGYEINKLIEQRGYREWAKIGTTSIYVGLRKLKEKQLIEPDIPAYKFGKGPSPVKFMITEQGQQVLHNEIIDCLSSTRERDARFDLGLAALPFINRREAEEALKKRQLFLRDASSHIKAAYEAQGEKKLPLHVRALFLHPVLLIEKELQFIYQLINELEGEAGDDY